MKRSEVLKLAINHLRMIDAVDAAKDVAAKMGADPSNISRALKGKPEASDRFMKRLNAAFGNIFNESWLLYGEGEMLTSDVTEIPAVEQGQLITTNPHGISYYNVGGKIMAKVPVMKFSAYGSMADDWGSLTADREDVETITVEVDRVSRGNYVIFTVDNDSMDDGTRHSFEAGDKIYVRELDRSDWMPRLRFDTWPYWVVAFGNNIRLKQITAQDEHGNITLHSLNPSPEFTDFQLSLDEVSHIYNVIRKIPKTVDFGK